MGHLMDGAVKNDDRCCCLGHCGHCWGGIWGPTARSVMCSGKDGSIAGHLDLIACVLNGAAPVLAPRMDFLLGL